MLRLCIRQLCNSIPHPPGLSSSSNHFVNESLVQLLEPYIPQTFTALTQIGRVIDEDLMEQVGSAGGLRSVLDNCPQRFCVSKIGSVYVARRLSGKETSRLVGESRAVVHTVTRTKSVHVFRGRTPPPVVFKRFPKFFVPVSAFETLERTTDDTAELQSDGGAAESIADCIKENEEFLDVLRLGGETFVRLIPGLAASADAFEKAQEERDGGSASVARRLGPHEVPAYEHFRVARLIPTADRFVPISSEMRQAALPLIAEKRDLLHVFVSEPQLFEVRENPHLEVRFLLDPNYRPSITRSAESIRQELEALTKSAVKGNGVRVPIDRKKKRTLLNELQYLENPSPYFDQTVMAHAIFDLLPLDAPASPGNILTILPKEAARCLPPNLHSFFRSYSYLFKTIDSFSQLLIQRADLPLPEQRLLSSVTSEEILMEVFNNYPRRRHPVVGSCIARCRERLPKIVRQRLREIDFVEDVVLKHPDKVELLDLCDKLFDKEVNKKLLPQYKCFRFVGEWQEALVKKYEALCAKHGYDPNSRMLITGD